MNGPARQDSPEIWHAALPYRNPAEFEVAACQFASDAASAGAAVLVACPAPSLDRIRDRLGPDGGHVTWEDIGDRGSNPGRMIHAIRRFTDQQDGRPAWCVQELAWPSRPADELWEVVRYEALLNLALAGPTRVLCPYHVGLPADALACARAVHPLTASPGGWEPTAGFRLPEAGSPVPPPCDQPLPAPPAGARELRYASELAGARALVTGTARAAGLSPSRASDLLIAVGELTANTLAHATGPGTLTIWVTPSSVVCQVRDSGRIDDLMAGQLRPGPAVEGGGRGLWVVHQLCDLVQLRSDPAGTTVRVHMRREP
ncbi:MAG TPA: sensor histidine kinase [Trebonia sp.]|jgi:anti-sigma regulatory factor (Ser/Thr protein kinase)|nr:sensor histidine kinase [Trebonia sp.]